jgi:SAM-dependent methyltransferase
MSESEQEDIIAKLKEIAAEAIDKSQPYGWFETLYQQAERDASKIPWAKLQAHPELTNWLAAQSIAQGEKCAIAIGCGLGDDAEALQAFGYNVTAFDISPTAIAWCRNRFPNSQVNYQVADLFSLPESWQSNFDLVFESKTVQALPIDVANKTETTLRAQAISAVTSLVKPDGKLLVIARTRPTNSLVEGPPWGLSPEELQEFIDLGFEKVSDRTFLDNQEIPHTFIIFSSLN